eukprot:5745874-Prymnesium_polylepis.2
MASVRSCVMRNVRVHDAPTAASRLPSKGASPERVVPSEHVAVQPMRRRDITRGIERGPAGTDDARRRSCRRARQHSSRRVASQQNSTFPSGGGTQQGNGTAITQSVAGPAAKKAVSSGVGLACTCRRELPEKGSMPGQLRPKRWTTRVSSSCSGLLLL